MPMKKEEFVPGSVIYRVNRDYKIISKSYINILKNHEINELEFDRYMSAVEEYTWLINVFPSTKIKSADYCIDYIGRIQYKVKKAR